MKKSKDDVVIVDGGRSAFGKFGGVLKETSSMELGVPIVKEIVRRATNHGIKKIDEVIWGHCVQCEVKSQAPVVARQVLIQAGLPTDTISITLERACCSSMSALQVAYRDILTGNADTAIVGGMENMSRVPYVIHDLRWGTRVGNVTLFDALAGMDPGDPIYGPVSNDVGDVTLEYGVSREDQDRWAYNSQMRYQRAFKEGKFKDEIIPLELKTKRGKAFTFDQDEFPKPDTTIEGLSKLKTVYQSKTVTPGNAPGLDAGASALLVMRRSLAESRDIKPLAKVLDVQSAAADVKYMAITPALAINKAIKRQGLSLKDVNLFEINEAFAGVVLVSLKILADGDDAVYQWLYDTTNVNGGAVAIGHPVGASGARIVLTLMHELRRRGGGIGAAGICGGMAQADATLLEIE